MKLFGTIIIALCFFFLNAQNLYSQTSADSLTVYELRDSIVTVANRYQISLKNLPYNYQMIEGPEAKALSLHSVLQAVDMKHPSAFVMEKKVMGFGVGSDGSGQVYLRGQGGHPNNGVLVLLNGHPDFMGIFGHPLPDVYGMDNIKQVEILSGPASTVFGNHAMGGVLNLVTSTDYSRPLKLQLESGNYNSSQVGLQLAKQFDRAGAFLSVKRQQSDGHLDQTSFEALRARGGLEYQFNDRWHLTMQGRYVPYEFDDPARGNADTAGLGAYGKIERGMAEIILKNNGNRFSGSAQLYSNFGHHRFYDGFESNDFTYGLSLYQFWRYDSRINLAGGVDLLHYGGQAENPYAFLPNGAPVVNDDQHEINSAGAYALVFYNPSSWLNFKLGARYQNNSLSHAHVSPMAAVTFHLKPNWQIYTSFKEGFRSPTPQELYLFPASNEELQEESIRSVEIGTMYRWQNAGALRFTYFRNNADNMIQTVSNNAPPPRQIFSNSGDADQWGLELQLQQRLPANMHAQISHAYLDADDLTAFSPAHQFKYQLHKRFRMINIFLYGKYVERLYAENHAQLRLPDYNILNGSVNVSMEHFDTYLKVRNLLDRTYQVLPGYKAPGIHGQLGVIYKW